MFPAGLCAATQICSSLTQTAQLPSGVSVAWPSPKVSAPTAARALQGPVERAGASGGVGWPAGGSGAGLAAAGPSGDLAALRRAVR